MNPATRWRPLFGHQISDDSGCGVNVLALPVGVEAAHHLGHFVAVGGDDGIVAGLRQVLRFPVQRLDEADLVVDDHRLLMRQVEGRVAVAHLDAGVGEQLARLLVLGSRRCAAPD